MKLISKEIWKPAYAFAGYYEVSTYGNVRGVDRLVKNSRSDTYKLWKGKRLSISRPKDKRRYVTLKLTVEGITYYPQLHRLVMDTFIGPQPAMQVNHIDGDKFNNKLENLEWVTSSENHIHARKTGLITTVFGEHTSNSKITKKQSLKIKSLRSKNYSYSQIAKSIGCSVKIVGDICRGRTWRNK